MARTALDIVKDYNFKVWNEQRTELVKEICADPITRHDAGRFRTMSHDEQVARIKMFAERGYKFSDVVLHGDDTFVTFVWDLVGDGGAFVRSGIEVFKVMEGRITEVWNSTYVEGLWV